MVITMSKILPRPGEGSLLRLGLAAAVEDVVDQAPGLRILGRHEVVALERRLDGFVIVASVLDVDLVQAALQLLRLLGVDHDVGGLALIAARGLVHHHARVRQREAHALLAGLQQQRAHRGRLADDERRDLRPDVLHRVVDRQARGHHAARAVDVHRDFLGRVLRLEEQQLRADQRRHAVMHRPREEDDPLLQQARVDVIGTLATRGLFDHHRHQRVHVEVDRILHSSAFPAVLRHDGRGTLPES
ncbi:hypothetical protein SDC9_30584 [bioreactor metagenome]|uniref:Uncharacterized protein n=1 Tax=bioreactor metagenome TaxID=1076179 RepID=A0A644UZV2_9ZZZZ